jgi:6-phosphogluconolactonase
MNIIEYADRDMLALDLAGRLASELNEALHHEDRVSLVVPGGTSPGPVFDDLCGAEVAWDRVDVALSDERWVPETSDRSNTRLIKDRLLTGPAAAARFGAPICRWGH